MAIEQAALQQTIAALHALAQSPAGSAVTGTLSEAELASAAGRLRAASRGGCAFGRPWQEEAS